MSKRKWEAPFARDLSAVRATGGLFTESLVEPLNLCINGTSVAGATCNVGTRVDGTGNCTPNGFDFTAGGSQYCSGGNDGSSGCISGTYAST